MKNKLSLLILPLLFLIACRNASFAPIAKTQFLMDTVVKISIYDTDLSASQCQTLLDTTFQMMAGIEQKVSMHIINSDVDRLNKAAGQAPVSVSKHTMQILDFALQTAQLSNGLFDPSIGVLKDLWNFDAPSPSVPDLKQIRTAQQLIDYQQIALREQQVYLKQAGMQLDMGGLAKGYIIDQAALFLKKNGIRAGIVDAGGDLRTWGRKLNGSDWRIGIRHPRSADVSMIGVLESGIGSIATSGDYERYFYENGKRYHHLLNPRTGFPADSVVSVTVMADNAMTADAYATLIFVLGPQRGMRFIRQTADAQCLILYEAEGKMKRLMTQDMKNRIQWQ